jgi:outer membrane receptor for ferrienterochelin and colicins
MKSKRVFFGLVFLMLFTFFTSIWAQEESNDSLFLTQSEERNSPKRELLIFEEIPLVISAAKHEQNILEAPSAVTIITKSDIENYGYRSLAGILRDVMGFDVINDRNYEYLGVRGFTRLGDYSTRVLVLVDGHITNDNWLGSSSIGFDFGIDPDLIEKIEIVRGPGSALYGTNAFFAIVNIITKRGRSLNGFLVSGELGSLGMKKGILGYGRKINKDLEFTFSGSVMDTKGGKLYYKEFDNGITDGWTEGTDYERVYAYLGNLQFKNLGIYSKFSYREKGIPTASYGIIFNDRRNKTMDARSFLELDYSHFFDTKRQFSGKIYFDNVYYKGYWYSDDPDYYFNIEKGGGNWVGFEGLYSWDISSRSRLMLGGEYQHHWLKTSNEWYNLENIFSDTDSYEDKYSYNFWALYLQEELKLNHRLSLTLGLHYDNYPVISGITNPRVAFIFTPFPKSTLKLLYGEAFRAPSIYEKYSTDYQTMETNPNLKPEKVKTFEGIWEQKLSANFRSRLALYRNDISKLIYQVLNEEGLLQYQNTSDAVASGAEFELNCKLSSGWSGFLNFALQDSKDKKTNKRVINVPRKIGSLGLVVPLYKEKVRLSLKEHYSDERIGKREDIKIPSYFLTDATFSAKNLIRNLNLYFSIYNLFDKVYYNAAGEEHIQDLIEQDGRSFRLKLSYLWEK